MATKWFTNLQESIGKAIPNEFSKMNSWTRYIPGIGQYLSILSAIDNGATAYSDIIERGGSGTQAFQGGGQGIMAGMTGASQDPGRYGSPNVNRDAWNTVGQVGNYFTLGQQGSGLGGSGVSPNYGGLIGLFSKDNPYFFKSTDKQNIENWYARQNATGSPYGQVPTSGGNATVGNSPVRWNDIYANPALNNLFGGMLNNMMGRQSQSPQQPQQNPYSSSMQAGNTALLQAVQMMNKMREDLAKQQIAKTLIANSMTQKNNQYANLGFMPTQQNSQLWNLQSQYPYIYT